MQKTFTAKQYLAFYVVKSHSPSIPACKSKEEDGKWAACSQCCLMAKLQYCIWPLPLLDAQDFCVTEHNILIFKLCYWRRYTATSFKWGKTLLGLYWRSPTSTKSTCTSTLLSAGSPLRNLLLTVVLVMTRQSALCSYDRK